MLLPVVHPVDSHAANLLELADGDLLCTWFNGPGEGDPGTNVVLSRRPAGAQQWTEPIVLAADPERSEQNPVLFTEPDGDVWLLHTSTEPHQATTSRVVKRVSSDSGRTWGEPEVLFHDPGIFLRNPPVLSEDGTWVLPVYHCTSNGHHSAVRLSTDRGRTWEEHPVPGSTGKVQMSVVPLTDGSLLGLFRSRDADRIHVSGSRDGGYSWERPCRTALPNNDSSIQAVRLANGHLAITFNDSTMERDQFRWVPRGDGFRRKPTRTPLTVAISTDDGETWPHWRNVQNADDAYDDNPAGYSYPSIMQASDGRIHLAYSYLRKAIKHVEFDESWVVDG